MGEADPGAEQHREPFHQALLYAVGANSILPGRRCPEHRDNVDVRAPRDRVASHDAAVEVPAVQARSERLGQQAGRRVGEPLILGLHVGEVGLGADVALGVKAVEVHLVIVADQAGSGMKRLALAVVVMVGVARRAPARRRQLRLVISHLLRLGAAPPTRSHGAPGCCL